MSSPLKTCDAPPERKDISHIFSERELVIAQENIQFILNAVPNLGIVLNEERQVVFANNNLIAMFGLKNMEAALGQRPGELLLCVHSNENEAGCGTSESCRYCGAVNIVLESQRTKSRAVGECRVSSEINGKPVSFDLRITATPLIYGSQQFTIVFMDDISDLKRRDLLEHVFLHDIINIAGGIEGLVSIISTENLDDKRQGYLSMLKKGSANLLEEVVAQRDLLLAETRQLVVDYSTVESAALIRSAMDILGNHKVTINSGASVRIAADSAVVSFQTDERLARRVLVNLIKNAIESSPIDGEVTVGAFTEEQYIVFYVINSIVMTDEVRHQIFQRSFSTKGKNRGIGTYSVKLITETYLKGKVNFTSTQETGTVFYVRFPR